VSYNRYRYLGHVFLGLEVVALLGIVVWVLW
jgi:hypothetical protein